MCVEMKEEAVAKLGSFINYGLFKDLCGKIVRD